MLLILGACAPRVGNHLNDRTSFNDGWKFSLLEAADSSDLSSPILDDSGWRQLTLPHDWAIEGTFSPDNPSGTGGGALPGGIGWYRKNFTTPAGLDENDRIFLDFDGAYMNTSVYVNGNLIGTRPYGYTSFSYDITPYLNNTGQNIIAVKVNNSDQPNSRWYSGCGIYRNVWLRHTHGVYIPLWGRHIVPYNVSEQSADLTVNSKIENPSSQPASTTVTTTLLSPNGKEVARKESTVTIAARSAGECRQELHIDSPLLWSTDSPHLYTVVTEVSTGDGNCNRYSEKTGFRTIDFDPVKGFSLNGHPMKINGVCLHHDAGALGAVVNHRAIERQLEIMKEMGVNAIRSSHNHPAPELLDICDSLGLMVMDEAFDMWRKKKTANDYARYFNEWHEQDLTDLILRDRNHPGIIMWSIGNEVLEQWNHADADTLSLDQANLLLNFGHNEARGDVDNQASVINAMLTQKLVDIVKDLDSTRTVTAGCNEPEPYNNLFKSGALDVIGYNYHDAWFNKVPEYFPGKPFIITESVSSLMTRGYYRMPSDSLYLWPAQWDKPFYDDSFACSSYGNCHAPWGCTHEKSLYDVANNDFISGQFIWTGFDYIGEPTPFGWPARSSYFGIVDLAGFPKDIYYMYQSQWRPDKTVLHLFPHWNWSEGDEVDMLAYYNNADEVELFVNGESMGVRQYEPRSYHAAWRVTYEPGYVEIVSRKDGQEVARKRIETAGTPSAIRLTPDRTEINADGKDLSYITVEIIDEKGNLCPLATNEVSFDINGPGFNAGVDNGSPISLEPFKADKRKAFYGKALLIVQSDGNNGDISVTAVADGLKNANTIIRAK